MKIFKWLGAGLGLVALIGAFAYARRTDPFMQIAGRQLTGEVVGERIDDWSFTDAYRLCAVETRPAAPHSVTTGCLAYDGALYVPAMRAAAKDWTYYAVAEPRARVKVGEKVYPVRATRVTDESVRQEVFTRFAAKVGMPADRFPTTEHVWLFRLDSAPADVAAGTPQLRRSVDATVRAWLGLGSRGTGESKPAPE